MRTRTTTPAADDQLMSDLLLPRTDAGVAVQALVVVPLLLGALVAVRRQSELRTFVLGVLLVTSGFMGLRTLH
jgi:hypothetical protein